MVERSNGEAGFQSQAGPTGCAEHGYEQILGFCKDCSCGICFRCAISKHRNHNVVNTDEVGRAELEPMFDIFDQKLQQLKDKAALLLEKAKSSETNADKLPEIQKYFEKIKEKF